MASRRPGEPAPAARAGPRAVGSGWASWPTPRCPTSRSPPAGCATRPCSRRWWPPGSSTCRTPTSSGAGSSCSTSATCCRRRPGARPTGSPRSCGRPLAEGLGLADEQEAQRSAAPDRPPDRAPVPADLEPRRPGARTAASRGTGRGRPLLEPVAPGVAVAVGRGGARPRARTPASRPAAAAARGRGGRRARARCWPRRPPPGWPRTAAPLPEPWPAEARDLLVRLLAAGPGLLRGLGDPRRDRGARPAPAGVAADPAAAARHRRSTGSPSTGTSWRRCVEAARLIRRVGAARPAAGRRAAPRHRQGRARSTTASPASRSPPGGGPDGVRARGRRDRRRRLVRWHLLLSETATSRDLDDPATIELVAERVGDLRHPRPARGAHRGRRPGDRRRRRGPRWRAGLVADARRPGPRRHLAARCRRRRVRRGPRAGHRRTTEPVRPATPRGAVATRRTCGSRWRRATDGAVVHGGRRRPGRADGRRRRGARAAAGCRCAPRAPGPSTRVAVSQWQVAGELAGRRRSCAARLRVGGRAGTVDPAARLRGRARRLPPVGRWSATTPRGEATVLEVRTEDRPGVVFLVCRALAALELTVRSAHVSTVGPQALDVFYVQEAGRRRAHRRAGGLGGACGTPGRWSARLPLTPDHGLRSAAPERRAAAGP